MLVIFTYLIVKFHSIIWKHSQCITVCFKNLPKLPTGPTANLRGLKDVDVKTEEVRDDKADDINGDCPPEGKSPKDGNIGGAEPGVVGPGLVMEG